MNGIEKALELIGTFLSAFYHEQNDLRGTTNALNAIRDQPQYRRELAYALKLLLESDTPSGALLKLVREAANRNVQTDEEARDYLRFVFHDNLLNYEIDYQDES